MPGDSGVESGRAQRQDFLHVNLPFSGEQQGTWQARLVHRGDGQRCDDQTYYLSSLARGLGRVHPFAARPNIVPGRPILATFRINESNRPKGGFDTVKADVELTRPGGAVQSMQLFDDGTNGDKLARNNIWSAELPSPADEPGIYHLRAHFELTAGSCTRVREAEYSIVAEPEPQTCPSLVAGGPLGAFQARRFQPGELRQVEELACVWNRCGRTDQYQVEISDSKGWLKTLSQEGKLVNLPASFETAQVPAFEGVCLGRGPAEGNPLAGIPILADVLVRLTPVDGGPTLRVQTAIEVAPPPDCNANGTDDAIDIARGTSKDSNGDTIPDECQGDHFHPPGADSDSDGSTDETDNCTDVPNADQRDTDGDGFGNMCDPDLNNDELVNVLDIGLFKRVFFTDDPDADLNGDGIVNVLDIGLFKPFFGGPPGPSGRAQ